MLINQEFMNSLSPVELEFIQTCITKLTHEKITPQTSNYENLNPHVECCPHCGSKNFVKNGFNPNHRQKYRCKDCHHIFSATTGTLFTHSKTSYEQWAVFIAGELNGLTLEAQSVTTGLSKTTCFNMRHKLYRAASKIQKDVRLTGNIELDPSYTKINLKGTKRENMPRHSKHRGKHKGTIYSRSIRGISGHKICMVTAIDENDNMLFKIAGLGPESIDKIDRFKDHFGKGSLIISDDKPCIKNFADKNEMASDVIPSTGGVVCFKTRLGNNIASVNELHTEAKNMLRAKHGVSTRHLQGYLDWLLFKKMMRYTVEMKKWKSTAYMKLMNEQIPLRATDIEKQKMPISLYEAYGEYHYGIFANIN